MAPDTVLPFDKNGWVSGCQENSYSSSPEWLEKDWRTYSSWLATMKNDLSYHNLSVEDATTSVQATCYLFAAILCLLVMPVHVKIINVWVYKSHSYRTRVNNCQNFAFFKWQVFWRVAGKFVQSYHLGSSLPRNLHNTAKKIYEYIQWREQQTISTGSSLGKLPTPMCPSSTSIIWYRPNGGEALWLER